MGAAPRPSPSPDQVARYFTGIYYRVAAKMPAELSKLYGASSQLHHGPGLNAQGVNDINSLSERLPLATASVSISSLRVQQTGTGAYVVSVIGSFGPCTNISDLPSNIDHISQDPDAYLQRLRCAKVVFSQSFVLEKTPDSHDDHFFCRNDIFTPVMIDDHLFNSTKQDEPLPPIHPTQSSSGTSSNDPNISKDNDVDSVPTTSHPTSSPVTPTPDSSSVKVQDVVTNVVGKVDPVPLPDNVVNGITPTTNDNVVIASSTNELVEQSINESTINVNNPATEIISNTPDVSTVVNESTTNPNILPNGDIAKDTQSSTPRAPVAPVKKTWASIVSSKDDLATNDTVIQGIIKQDPTSVTATKDLNSTSVPIQVNVSNANMNQSTNAPVSDANQIASKNQSQYNLSNGQRTGNYGHMNRNNNQRQYGPSAVVQLSSLNSELLQDSRALALSMRDEFSNYGHRARHVEVKIQKGIAFVEYESMEGVKAAVSAWGNGPRTEGIFAGVALNVTEKRPFYNRRPNNVRGGRGGTRGGRRNNNRPTSTTMS